MSRQWRIRRWMVAAAAATLATTACSSGTGEEPSGDATSTTTPTATADANGEGAYLPSDSTARSFDKSREVNLPEEGVVDAAMPAEHLLTMTGSTVQDRAFPDLAENWAATTPAGQFVDLLVDGDAVYTLAIRNVPGSGTKIGSNTFMVSKFDLETGNPLGAGAGTLKQNASGASQAAIGQIVSVAGNRVLLNALAPPQSDAAGDPPTAIAIKLGSPTPEPTTNTKPAWSRPGAAILWGNAQRIVLSMANPNKPADVVIASAKNGRRLARLAEFTTSASVVGTSANTVTLASTDGLFNVAQVGRYSLRTGRVVKGGKPRTVATSSFTCRAASRQAAACSVGDGTLVGWNLRKNRPTWKLPTGKRFAPHVTTVKDGLLYGNLDDGTGVVLDARTGKDVTPASGAGPVDVNEYGGVTLYLGIAVFTPQGTTPDGATSSQPSELAE